MAIALVGTPVNAQSITSINVTTAAYDTTGANLLIAVVSSNENVSTTSDVTDSVNGSTGWNALTPYASTNRRVRIWWSQASTGASQTFTVSGSFNIDYPSVSVMAFSGAAVASAFDAKNGNFTNGATSLATGSVSIAEAGSLAITGLSCDSGSSATVSGYTVVAQFNFNGTGGVGIASAYKLGVSGSENPSWSWSGSDQAGAGVAIFKPAGGGGGGNPWYAYAQQRTKVERTWNKNGLLWQPSYVLAG